MAPWLTNSRVSSEAGAERSSSTWSAPSAKSSGPRASSRRAKPGFSITTRWRVSECAMKNALRPSLPVGPATEPPGTW